MLRTVCNPVRISGAARQNTSAREVLGFAGKDIYPAGIPFEGAQPYPERALKEQAKL